MTQDIEQLVIAIKTLANSYNISQFSSKNLTLDFSFQDYPELEISPRQAYFSATETIPLAQARDRISGELICPYPPGIPILIPGEVITQDAIDYLQEVLSSGGVITGCCDHSLETLKVLL